MSGNPAAVAACCPCVDTPTMLRSLRRREPNFACQVISVPNERRLRDYLSHLLRARLVGASKRVRKSRGVVVRRWEYCYGVGRRLQRTSPELGFTGTEHDFLMHAYRAIRSLHRQSFRIHSTVVVTQQVFHSWVYEHEPNIRTY